MRVRVFDSLAGLEPAWRTVEREGYAYAYQTWAWITTWQEQVGARSGVMPCPVLIESAAGEPLMVLPLGVRHGRTVRVLEWLGGTLADYNGPLIGKEQDEVVTPKTFQALWRRVLDELPAHDVINFERQPKTIGPLPNPFILPGCVLHPSRAHSTALGGTLDELLKTKRSASWRSKERRKERRLAEHGDITFVHAKSPAEIERILPEMMRQKSRSYRDLGAVDIFAVPGYRTFVTALTQDHAADGFVFLGALMVGDRIEATYWGVVFDRRFYHLLPTYEIDELTKYAPGNVLLRRLFEWCLDNDIEVFDFTSGDDEYKAPWTDISLLLYDYSRAVTRRGSTYVAAVGFQRELKKRIKRSPVLLDRARRVRAQIGRFRR